VFKNVSYKAVNEANDPDGIRFVSKYGRRAQKNVVEALANAKKCILFRVEK
jgi:hypothetical protein